MSASLLELGAVVSLPVIGGDGVVVGLRAARPGRDHAFYEVQGQFGLLLYRREELEVLAQ